MNFSERSMHKDFITMDQARMRAPAAFHNAPHENVSSRYSFISSYEIIQTMSDLNWGLTAIGQQGRELTAPHIMRFRKREGDYQFDVNEEIPELVGFNSHNRILAFKMKFGLFRLACDNGYIMNAIEIGDLTRKHVGNVSQYLPEYIEAFAVSSGKIMEEIQHYKEIDLTRSTKLELADNVINRVFNKQIENGKVFEPSSAIVPLRSSDYKDDLWTTFSTIQERIIKGGIEGITPKNRRTTTRQISSPITDMDRNLIMWGILQQFAQTRF
jgi:hypothetical protein